MKRLGFIVLLAVVVVGGLAANAAREDPLSGTWYGGSTMAEHQGYKYQYVISPIGPDRWQLLGDGAYNADTFGAALKTSWSGEIRKNGNHYDLRLMCLTSTDPTDPPNVLPTIIAGHANVILVGPDEISFEYDAAGTFTWGTVPFVDKAAAWMYTPSSGPGSLETLRRLKMDGAIRY